MFHTRKQEFMGCAIATAAMIADSTYEEVAARCPGEDPARLRWPHRLRRLLETMTQSRWRRRWLWRRCPVRDFPFPDWPVAVFLQDGWWRPHFGQWVVVKGPLVHDPALPGAVVIDRYPRKDWLVAKLLQPAQPTGLQGDVSRARTALVLKELADQLSGPLAPLSDCRWDRVPGSHRER
jgi:hypothetical protein